MAAVRLHACVSTPHEARFQSCMNLTPQCVCLAWQVEAGIVLTGIYSIGSHFIEISIQGGLHRLLLAIVYAA